MTKPLAQMYAQATRLLEYAIAEEFDDAEARFGFELEHGLFIRNLTGSQKLKIRDLFGETNKDPSSPYQYFEFESPEQKVEITTSPLPLAKALTALRSYKRNLGKWLEKTNIDVEGIVFESFIHLKNGDKAGRSLHGNMSLWKNGENQFDEMPAFMMQAIQAMTLEVIRQNSLLLISDPEQFNRLHAKKLLRCAKKHDVDYALCLRDGDAGNYLEIRCAEATTPPEAVAMVGLLGMYLGMDDPDMEITKRPIHIPETLAESVYHFNHGTLLRETLDRLAHRYGATLDIPENLGTQIHEAVMEQHTKQLKPLSEMPGIDVHPVAVYPNRATRKKH